MEIHLPTQLLSPFIRHFMIMESREEMTNRIFPDTSLVMSFRYKGQVNFLLKDTKTALSSFTLTGLRKSNRVINYTKDTANILVVFREAAAHAFIKEPLHELFEDSVPLDNFTGYQHLSAIGEQLAAAHNHTQRINIIEAFLLERLYNHRPDALITAALKKIRAANGIIRIKDLAGALYISQDAFEKRFRRMVGISPKQFAYIVKMRAVVNNVLNLVPAASSARDAAEKISLAGIAFDAGYFDQPHFNKDFKLFTGQTPTEFMKNPMIM
ncbi:helix-turn-helix transcriptional regulator [Pseudoflavitalea sp. X16]|uniref:helix-turn-helix transcriptional regulator n=1 Tax=Paraflavitalea devenefica TaxID=2716334 RepID=UPI001422FDF0|nr:helix-turn-helix transcriptional regulator [Paraflavitalea devenefica]NII26375.1 helix-turn-helix transcriptional regulator [Paraflavitalea devenefica]